MIGNKIAEKITLVGKTKSKEKRKEDGTKTYVSPEKRHQIIDDSNCFKHSIRMKYQKITNLLDATSDKAPRFITKNG